MTEAKFYAKMRDTFKRVSLYRVESCIGGTPGLPDIYATDGRGGSMWIELKHEPTAQRKIRFQRSQPGIIRDLYDSGILILIVTKTDKDGIWVHEPHQVDKLADNKLADVKPLRRFKDSELHHMEAWLEASMVIHQVRISDSPPVRRLHRRQSQPTGAARPSANH